MRYENFAKNEHYHVYGSSSNGQKIFIDERDAIRFLFLITHFQSPTRVYNTSWYTESFFKKGSFSTKEDRVFKILKQRNIYLLSFVLLPDSFHLLVKNLEQGILSVYMHRVLTAYSKYFNSKYKKRGHVFESPFKTESVKDSELANFSASIHYMPTRLGDWKNSCEKYPYSSFQDYVGSNRWGDFLFTNPILKQFKNQAKYRDFVNERASKGILYEL